MQSRAQSTHVTGVRVRPLLKILLFRLLILPLAIAQFQLGTCSQLPYKPLFPFLQPFFPIHVVYTVMSSTQTLKNWER